MLSKFSPLLLLICICVPFCVSFDTRLSCSSSFYCSETWSCAILSLLLLGMCTSVSCCAFLDSFDAYLILMPCLLNTSYFYYVRVSFQDVFKMYLSFPKPFWWAMWTNLSLLGVRLYVSGSPSLVQHNSALGFMFLWPWEIAEEGLYWFIGESSKWTIWSVHIENKNKAIIY